MTNLPRLFAKLKEWPRMIPISVEREVEAASMPSKASWSTRLAASRSRSSISNHRDPARQPQLAERRGGLSRARAMGLGSRRNRRGLKSYPGLAHRQELIATIDGVRYVNDSKATNADAAAKALVCYDNIYWIVGGQRQGRRPRHSRAFYPRVRHAYLIGECAQRSPSSSARPCTSRSAARWTRPSSRRRCRTRGPQAGASCCCRRPALLGPVPNFEARGDHFRALVLASAGKGAA
jgi:UDP-N-acetylmuramoylalanine--D-glutamate ligase